jgi:hypothetical protein
VPLLSTRGRSVTERLNELTHGKGPEKCSAGGARALHFDSADVVEHTLSAPSIRPKNMLSMPGVPAA